MKKLLLLLLLSLGFIGPVYAAKNAGLALTYGFGSVAIAAGLGFVLFILIKPKKDSENKKAVYYGRLFLAFIIWIQTAAIFPQFVINQNINTFMAWLAGMIAFGFIAYVIGSVYGASKKTAGKLVKKTKTITKTAIEKSVEKPQELATEKNITKNENTMDEENSDEINDEEFYLIATEEVEGGDINQALWAKCMAINMGDEKKSKYDYINKRVAILIKDTNEAAILKVADEEIQRLDEKEKIENDKDFRKGYHRMPDGSLIKDSDHPKKDKKEQEVTSVEKQVDNYSKDGIKFKSKEDYEAYATLLEKRLESDTAKTALEKRIEDTAKTALEKRLERQAAQEKKISEEAENYSKDGIKFKSKEDYEAYIDLHSNDKE